MDAVGAIALNEAAVIFHGMSVGEMLIDEMFPEFLSDMSPGEDLNNDPLKECFLPIDDFGCDPQITPEEVLIFAEELHDFINSKETTREELDEFFESSASDPLNLMVSNWPESLASYLNKTGRRPIW